MAFVHLFARVSFVGRNCALLSLSLGNKLLQNQLCLLQGRCVHPLAGHLPYKSKSLGDHISFSSSFSH